MRHLCLRSLKVQMSSKPWSYATVKVWLILHSSQCTPNPMTIDSCDSALRTPFLFRADEKWRANARSETDLKTMKWLTVKKTKTSHSDHDSGEYCYRLQIKLQTFIPVNESRPMRRFSKTKWLGRGISDAKLTSCNRQRFACIAPTVTSPHTAQHLVAR